MSIEVILPERDLPHQHGLVQLLARLPAFLTARQREHDENGSCW
jgi:hypothetical protein